MITILSIDGTGGKGGPTSMMSNVWRPLVDAGGYEVIDVPYDNAIGPAPNPYDWSTWMREGVDDGAHKVAEAVTATPHPAALVSYSMGSAVVSKYLADLAAGAAYCRNTNGTRHDVRWAVTIANPNRAFEPARPDWGFGVAGEHAPFPRNVAHFEVANYDDGIPCCPRYSPLRTMTDVGQDPTPQGMLNTAQRNAWQTIIPELPARFRDPAFWLRDPTAQEQLRVFYWLVAEAIEAKNGWLSAAGYLRGYLDGTAHGSDYWTRDLFAPVVRELLARRWE